MAASPSPSQRPDGAGMLRGERGHSMHFAASLLAQANQSTSKVLCVRLSILKRVSHFAATITL